MVGPDKPTASLKQKVEVWQGSAWAWSPDSCVGPSALLPACGGTQGKAGHLSDPQASHLSSKRNGRGVARVL